MEKVQKHLKKSRFSNNLGLLFRATEPEVGTKLTLEVATEPKNKTKSKISSLKLRENFLNEIKNDEKNMNEQIFQEYFGYRSPSILVKDLLYKNDTIVKLINELLIDLRNSIDGEKIPQNENPKKVVDIVEKILLDFNKQQKVKELKY